MTTHTHEHTTSCWWNPSEARWQCPAPATVDAEPALVDVRDMIVVHTALLREFRLAPAAVRRVCDGSVRRAAMVDRHLAFLCDLLHHHHAGEDELLWPLMRDRVPVTAVRFLDEVEEQHGRIDAALQAVTVARARWTDDPGPVHRDGLAADLTHLYRLLTEHLELEERAVLPLAASVLSEAEWQAVGAAAVAALPKPALPLVFGMFAYEGDPAVLKGMLSAAPVLPRLLLPRIAPRVYARRAARVHASSRP